MEKKRKFLFLKSVLVLLVFLLFDLLIYAYESKLKPGLTGFSIRSDVVGIYSNLPVFSKIFFIGQWIILLFLVIFIILRKRKNKKYKDESININLKGNYDKKKTDLDVLYDILKKQKELKLSTISKSFKVSGEVAKEWCNILESANLASIEYPGFGEPLVKIIDKNAEALTKEGKKDYEKNVKKMPPKPEIKKIVKKMPPKPEIKKDYEKNVKKMPPNPKTKKTKKE